MIEANNFIHVVPEQLNRSYPQSQEQDSAENYITQMISTLTRSSEDIHNQVVTIPIRRNVKPKIVTTINYNQFTEDNNCIKKLRILDLKTTIKELRFKLQCWNPKVIRHYDFILMGSKNALIDRILKIFNMTRCSIIIQRMSRGLMARTFFKLKKYHHINNDDRVVCINDTDFVTLDNVKEIPYKLFFSYTDSSNFTYGFNILSLILLYKKREDFQNPYNRSDISNDVLDKMICIYNLIGILFPGTIDGFLPMKKYISHNRFPIRRIISQRRRNNIREVPGESMYNIEPEQLNEIRSRMIAIRGESVRPDSTELDYALLFPSDLIEIVDILPQQPIIGVNLNQRIENVFSEMNNLGNDTRSSWFLNLSKIEYYKLYDTIYDLWQYRLHLSPIIKSQICPMGSPFTGSRMNDNPFNSTTIVDARRSCIFIIENMIFSGIDIDSRKVGVLQVLTALTSVSLPARDSLQYLYESLF